MKKNSQHRIYKVIWVIMALHILNFSVDAPDAQDNSIAEDLSYNEIESIAEWFAEDVLQIEDAFSEKDENDQDDFSFTKKATAFEFCQMIFNTPYKNLFYPVAQTNNTFVDYKRPSLGIPYLEVFNPPPEA
ncbi:hypothetical protein IRZ71_21650 [Flavobacterium sp. ANB]|uniref:hypothetical protein n=1 Tax=unclassified Flavobacterium TaxID=196869 RepID=UPI0012B9CE3D|nr:MULTISPECIES: hypothetical protein [unclassified Flavobacterium]MBF4518970.1 hypothetical protein [Flavobacterium sp. ANB]MTD71579.1 hypothetical protein [Flavobacterium sp. LC2016-13]